MKITNNISQAAMIAGSSSGRSTKRMHCSQLAPLARALCSSSGLIASSMPDTVRVANGKNRAI